MSSVRAKSDIRALREWFGMTQAEFARAVGVSERAIIRWEGGEVEPMPAARRSLDMLEDVRRLLIKRFSEPKAREWLREPLRQLRGNSPFEVLVVGGPLSVRDLLIGADSGAYR
jgi:predicted transcriptional regulator